jgi:hypothetical protein
VAFLGISDLGKTIQQSLTGTSALAIQKAGLAEQRETKTAIQQVAAGQATTNRHLEQIKNGGGLA